MREERGVRHLARASSLERETDMERQRETERKRERDPVLKVGTGQPTVSNERPS